VSQVPFSTLCSLVLLPSGTLEWRIFANEESIAASAKASASYTDKFAGTLTALLLCSINQDGKKLIEHPVAFSELEFGE